MTSTTTALQDPRSAPPLRWGVLGPGWIAGTFAAAVHGWTQGRVVAVGSRDRERAEAFAARFEVPTTHVGYEALVADPQVDAVYVASPHSGHHAHALLAIAAGKHVLVEKSFTRNASEAQEVVDAARAAGVFCMEAMWTRFLPHMVALRQVLARGEVGEVVAVQADHGQGFAHMPDTHRLHARELAGGALLDLGVYPVSFAHDVLGEPQVVTALGSLTRTGVDGQVTMGLGYGDRAQAALHTTLWARTATTAVVAGSEGRIEVATDFYRPTSFTVVRDDGSRWTFDQEVDGGFQYQAAEVARRVAEGRTESPVMPLDGTLAVMRTMDEVRRLVGVAYPGE
ncbi:Gfo/Idh/MocA family protein [Cellulomonas bogoriensis]|uniref:Oxidoreductase n=1 Tax=Cellulomonas bogoriensis 69B4 = DSM 16987 TaxID=1386082 RepID=A0A0A0BMR4_9CELL|nr:Gfo/Idh/MocA family oxidoreductase [Cellulomonas bogoriensis]KGM09007.1 oxidoreductase [Cellulomonas bogoriensis 69B4 = DSM 16987]